MEVEKEKEVIVISDPRVMGALKQVMDYIPTTSKAVAVAFALTRAAANLGQTNGVEEK